jgi:hypothetical protein
MGNLSKDAYDIAKRATREERSLGGRRRTGHHQFDAGSKLAPPQDAVVESVEERPGPTSAVMEFSSIDAEGARVHDREAVWVERRSFVRRRGKCRPVEAVRDVRNIYSKAMTKVCGDRFVDRCYDVSRPDDVPLEAPIERAKDRSGAGRVKPPTVAEVCDPGHSRTPCYGAKQV